VKRFILVFLAVLLLLGVLTFLLPLKDVTIEGENNYYSEKELIEKVMDGKSSRALIFFLQEKFGKHRTIPFIEKYSVSFRGFRHAVITVYERNLIGFLRFQQYYLYFDWSGTLVESSTVRLPGIFEVTGLGNSRAVVGGKLDTEHPDCFDTILTITQFLDSSKVTLPEGEKLLSDCADSIHFSSAGVSVIFGETSVLLGSSEYLEEKLSVMCDSLAELYGRSGTLYLDSYKPGQAHPSYIFK